MKRVVVLCLVMCLTLTGCSKAEVTVKADDKPVIAGETTLPAITPTPIPMKPATSVNATDMPGFSTSASSAVAPAEVNIGNLYPGATAEFQLLIHNGDGLKNKLLQITTERDETIAAIPINVVLANSGLLDIISIESTLAGEKLEAIAYDGNTKLLTIKGFKPLEKRIVKITYRTLSNFNYYFRSPDKTREGFKISPSIIGEWVTFDKTGLLLRPMETGNVVCTLKIPSNITDSEAQFVNISENGKIYLNTQKTTYYKALVQKYGISYGYNQTNPLPPIAIKPEWVNPYIEKLAQDELLSHADMELLSYIATNRSVLMKEFKSTEQLSYLVDFIANEYIHGGDLRKGKWEFWIGVMERGVGQSSQISTEIELCSRILVTMR